MVAVGRLPYVSSVPGSEIGVLDHEHDDRASTDADGDHLDGAISGETDRGAPADGADLDDVLADRAARSGFERFFLASRGVVFGACVAMVGGDREAAADLAQEAFARAFENWATVSVHPNPQAWVLRTARNLNTSNWRRMKRAIRIGSARPTPPGDVGDRIASDGAVIDALASLPPSQRICTYLVVVAGFSADEAASVVGCSPSTVRTHLQRARAALQQSSGLVAQEEW